MKQLKFLLIALVASTAGYTGYSTYAQNSSETSSLLIENVIALSEEGEWDYPDGYPFTSKCGVQITRWRTCQTTVITCQGGGNGCNEQKCPTHKRD